MPRDLFGAVTDPPASLSTRKWYGVPLAFAIHLLAVVAVVIVPLMASGVLPPLATGGVRWTIQHVELPRPPVVRPAVERRAPTPDRSAPVVAPDAIHEEPPEVSMPDAGLSTDPLVGAGLIEGDASAVVAPPPAPAATAAPAKAVRPGGVVRVPERVAYVAPVYPPLAQTARVQGIVILEAMIDVSGRVHDARVLRSDSPLLNEAALAAVRQWTYTPTLLNGVPVSVIMTVTVQFRLQ